MYRVINEHTGNKKNFMEKRINTSDFLFK